MTKRTYITAARLTALQRDLRPTDWALLQDTARLNLASGDQLRRLHYQDNATGQRMARLDLRHLVDRDLLTRIGRQVGGRRAGSKGYVYGLSVAGKRLVGPKTDRPREPWTPTSNSLRHVLAVSELYVQLREMEDHSRFTLERFDAEPRCWRTFSGPGGSRSTLKPDAYALTVTTDYIDSWFIELDRATESVSRIKDKAKAYGRYWQSGREQEREGVFPAVLFVVPDNNRQVQLVNALTRQPADQWRLFRVVTADAAAQAIVEGELLSEHDRREEVNS
jgi:hypothetical protein